MMILISLEHLFRHIKVKIASLYQNFFEIKLVRVRCEVKDRGTAGRRQAVVYPTELKPYIYGFIRPDMRVYGCIMRVGAYMGLTGIFGQLENFRS